MHFHYNYILHFFYSLTFFTFDLGDDHHLLLKGILPGLNHLSLLLLFYRYESLVGTVAKKFSTKRKRSSVGASFEPDSPSTHQPSKKTKREFMKPRD